MRIEAEKLKALAENLEYGASADIYFDAGYWANHEEGEEREALENTQSSIEELCAAQAEAADILRGLAEGRMNGCFLVENCQEEDIIKMVPEECPECGCKDLEIDGNQALIADAAVGRLVEGGKFLAYEVKDWNPLYYIGYGWQCPSCGHEVSFERAMRVAYV